MSGVMPLDVFYFPIQRQCTMTYASIEAVQAGLRTHNYIADRGLATTLFLALKMQRPLFLEGEAGVGKTEVAKVLAGMLGGQLIRLQCYEGLDVNTAVYEWNYARQMLQIRMLEADKQDQDAIQQEIFGPDYLIKRPLLTALEAGTMDSPVVLLIDELDRADEEFEAFLLELLSDFQITIPELGTIKATVPPPCHHHLQQDAGNPRCTEKTVPLSLGRLPVFRKRTSHYSDARAGTISRPCETSCCVPARTSCGGFV